MRSGEIIQSIQWMYVLLLTLTLTTLHLAFHSQSVQKHIPNSLISSHGGEEYLAFVLVARDEGYYLKEWLQHHYYHMNVSRFYIMDDDSNPPLHTIKDLGIPRSAVTFRYHQNEIFVSSENKRELAERQQSFQLRNYIWAMQEYGHKHTWMGFIDLDEFFDIKTTETMEAILRDAETYDDIGAIKVNWKTHTAAGLIERPESMREAFDVCIDPDGDVKDLDDMTKTLVRTDRWTLPQITPHQASLHTGNFSVGEDLKECEQPPNQRIPSSHNRLFLHHYMTKSRNEFQAKIDRWPGNPRNWQLWERLEALPHVNCSEMKRYDP